MRGFLFAVVVIASCGRVRFDPLQDAAGDAVVDGAAPLCDPSVPFGTPVPIAELNVPGAYDSTITLTSDELTAYWYSDRGNASMAFDLWTAMRSDPAGQFTNVTQLTALDSPQIDKEPGVSPDGSLLVFVSTRTDPEGDIYLSMPTGSAPVAVAVLDSTSIEEHPFIQIASTDFYFSSNRLGLFSIYHATYLGGGAFTAPSQLADLDVAGANTDDATVGRGGLVAYIRSNRPGGLGGEDIWRAERATPSDTWGAAVLEPAINSALLDTPSWLSPDLCRLYMSSSRTDTSDLYVASRVP